PRPARDRGRRALSRDRAGADRAARAAPRERHPVRDLSGARRPAAERLRALVEQRAVAPWLPRVLAGTHLPPRPVRLRLHRTAMAERPRRRRPLVDHRPPRVGLRRGRADCVHAERVLRPLPPAAPAHRLLARPLRRARDRDAAVRGRSDRRPAVDRALPDSDEPRVPGRLRPDRQRVVRARRRPVDGGLLPHVGEHRALLRPGRVARAPRVRRPPARRSYALYPGTGLILLALVGSWHGLRHRGLRRWTLYGLAVVVAFVLLSFGPLLAEASFGSLLGALYAVLRAAYPGFRLARNLWRFGGLAPVFLATLAGFGLAACFGPEPHRPRRALLGGALTVALGLELFSAPIPLLDLGRKPTELAWVRWLRDSPPGPAIIQPPMPPRVRPDDFERTTFWMY